MLKFRPAVKEDGKEIIAIIKALDLSYPNQSLDGFWVAEEDGKIMGISCLEKFEDFYFLSAVGVPEKYRLHGIASKLVNKLVRAAKHDVYLYTVIPGYFKKLGFKPIDAPDFLPARQTFSCKKCTPEACTCMVRRKRGL
jgi:N-acetylglutamate synthase-like GNAT family acetyltransferase